MQELNPDEGAGQRRTELEAERQALGALSDDLRNRRQCPIGLHLCGRIDHREPHTFLEEIDWERAAEQRLYALLSVDNETEAALSIDIVGELWTWLDAGLDFRQK